MRQPSCVKDEHTKFSGSIPAAYDRYLGPILFQPYAEDLAARLAVNETGSVLELACGTGILTRVLRTHLPSKVKLIATDLNEPMFRQAAAKFGKNERVRWLEADACDLPFDDRKFDAVVCQFGIMFVPDKALAAREAYRVLKRDGLFLFNVWDAMRHNKLGELAHRTITSYFENDPPTFYKVPFSYHNRAEIRRILKQAGFREIKTEVIAKIGKANAGGRCGKRFGRREPCSGDDCEARSFITSHNHRRRDRCDYASIWRTRYPCTNAGDCGPGPRLTDRDADRGAFCLVHASAILPQTATGR